MVCEEYKTRDIIHEIVKPKCISNIDGLLYLEINTGKMFSHVNSVTQDSGHRLLTASTLNLGP